MITRDQVIAQLKQRGPSLPAELTSALKENTIIVGAFLSELISSGLVNITKAKIGGSPLYYLPEHHPQIIRLGPHLNEKDRKAFELLQKHKVVRDDTLTPLERACMRAIVDFALPVTVRNGQEEYLFWRWFLTAQEEAQKLITASLIKTMAPEQKQAIPVTTESTESTDPIKKTSVPQTPPAAVVPPIAPHVSHAPSTSPALPASSVAQKTSPQSNEKPARPVHKQPAEQPQKSRKETRKKNGQSTLAQADDVQQQQFPDDSFFSTVKTVLDEKKIIIDTCTVIKAGSELDMQVRVPSAIGHITYFAKARKKKNCNDGDVAAAALQGQNRRMPVLFICTGKVTKKVHTMLAGEFSTVSVLENIGE